jgi:shikimate kinase
MRIVLLGFMGCGKTSTGQLLADKMGYEFADLDHEIESASKATIEELFRDKGEKAFRKMEYEALCQLLKKEDTVLSLGGGAPCFFNSMELINTSSVSVYLKMSADSLFSRLLNERKHRPLIKDLSEKELKDFISEMLYIREPFYNRAHYKIKAKEIQVGALVDFLMQAQHQFN